MGTVTERRRKDGSIAYKAQIRIMQQGSSAVSETETFDRKTAAKAWIKKRESELSEPGAIEALGRPNPPLSDIIDRYLSDFGQVRRLGRTKAATLRAIAAHELGSLKASDVTSPVLVSFAQQRIAEDRVKPQTVQNDIALLGSVFAVAEAAWGYPLSNAEMVKAKAVAKHLGLMERSNERTRVPTMEELDRLMAYFADQSRRRRWVVPMQKLVAAAIFTTRRQEELVTMRWDDLNVEHQTILIRDVKHPRHKAGNHKDARLTDEALALIRSMPKVDDRIFPFSTEAVSAQFTRACQWLEIEDLRFHDLRRAGVTRLFEMGWTIPEVASVSLHQSWQQLKRYTAIKKMGDRYAGWKWLQPAIDIQWNAGRRVTAEMRKKKTSSGAHINIEA